MPSLSAALALATARLKDAGIDTPALDARLLLQAVTGHDRAALLLQGESELPPEQLLIFGSLIDRRAAREPVARILGVREFWGLPFKLSKGTLEPRPDSETLIEAALQNIPDKKAPLKLLDLGTGTGCLLAALLHELPNAVGLGIDKNPEAVVTARANMAELDLSERAVIREGTWAEGVDDVFDLIISNPPYIKSDEALQPEVQQHDPHLALFAGEDGLEAYRALAAELPRLMVLNSLAVLELGMGQGPGVSALMEAQGLKVQEIRADFNEIPRALLLRLQQK